MLSRLSSPSTTIATKIIKRPICQLFSATSIIPPVKPRFSHQHRTSLIMSQQFSNAQVGNGKPADPYRKANLDNETPLADKIQDLANFINSCKFCMMTTHDAKSGNLASRCMALAATETGGIDLLFHTNTESGKTDELSSDSHINCSFLNSSGEWASVSGRANIITDRELVKKHYSPTLKAWLGDLEDGVHDGGPEDPRIGVIRVKMTTAHYAIVSKNIIGRVAEVAQGTLTGKPAAVNKLREINEQDVNNWRGSH
ncbi:putative BLI-3 blue-light-inducible Bli-3 protein [Bombardia bombarda]|uniref:BLI-3 blue-light-inducible Bli-3 protein n=1 Tax=Bombardia bombarda TaxID=252184 RepID=A0AA40CFQ7_9PEZI|nr:putative BLI-3 blue-light-inducible Bli-3 protein [Bombardia bombarda]